MECKRFRKSFAIAFETCPLMADLQFNQGIEVPSAEMASFGTRGHGLVTGFLSDQIMWSRIENEEDDELRDLVETCIGMNPYGDRVCQFEREIQVTQRGRYCGAKGGFWTGRLDMLVMPVDGFGAVPDFKFGRVRRDHEVERHEYVWLYQKATGYKAKEVAFEYWYPRFEERVVWTYHFDTAKYVMIEDPSGHVEAMKAPKGVDPLLHFLRGKRDAIVASDGQPTPGDHCETLYGVGCPYAGTHCTIRVDPNAILVPADLPENQQAWLELPVEQRRALAFAMALKDPDLPMSPYMGGLAKEATMSLSLQIRRVNAALKKWCEKTGQNLKVGDDEYGLVPGPGKVDVVWVLNHLLNDLKWPLEEVARLVNMSPSSLRFRKKDKSVEDWVRAMAVTKGKPGAAMGLIEKGK